MILLFLETRIGRGLAVAVACGVAFLLFASHERGIGSRSAITKIEKATSNAVTLGTRAARKSGTDGVRKLDPTTRND